jgi:hypothetical protein
MRRITTDALGRVEIGDDLPEHHFHPRQMVRRQTPSMSGAAKPTRTQITKPEYAALTYVTAQKLTGSTTATPTAKQVAEAQKQAQAAILKAGVGVQGGTAKVDKLFNKARAELSGISGMGDAECAGLWEIIKDAIVKAAPAMPFIGPAAGLAMATAPIIVAKNAKKAQKPTPAAAPTDAASSAPAASASTSADATEPQVVGDDVLVYGHDGPDGPRGESIRSAYDRALAQLSGEDEIIFGEGGGSSELGAAGRMKRPYYFPPGATLGDDPSTISPTMYRLAVIQRATKLAGGGKPQTKHMFFAQKSVDKDLASGGISVSNPGGRPGRVTR